MYKMQETFALIILRATLCCVSRSDLVQTFEMSFRGAFNGKLRLHSINRGFGSQELINLLHFVKLRVFCAALHEFLVRAFLHDFAVLEHANDVGVLDGCQSMCDCHACSSLSRFVEGGLDDAFALIVECGGGFVEKENFRVPVGWEIF